MSTHSSHDENTIPLPTGTAWPMVAAFGIGLMFAGLVTSFFVCAVGFVAALIAAVGWFFDVFPHPQHEYVPLNPLDKQPAPIKVSTQKVAHLKIGHGGHRVRIPVEVNSYSAGVLGGLAGGAAMAILALLYGLIWKGSIWYPINLLAAAGLPSLSEGGVQTLMQFNLVAFLLAVVIHVVGSIIVGLLYTVILPMLPQRYEWFWGGIMTPIIWTGLIWATIGILNPLLKEYIDWTAFLICQVAFGVVGGYVVFKSEKVETMQSWPLAAKLGVEVLPEEKE